MNERPEPPEGYDDNPPLGPDFYDRARPAQFGEALSSMLLRKDVAYAGGKDATVGEASDGHRINEG